MSEQVLVTIQGSQDTIAIELPDDVCVGDLLPLLGEIYAFTSDLPAVMPEETGGWSLCVERNNIPLLATRTLADYGILDGDVLLLQEQTPRKTLSPEREIATPAFNNFVPGEETGWIGVTWAGRR